jgi:hypothetical protein
MNHNGDEDLDSKNDTSPMRTPDDHRLAVPGSTSTHKQSRRQGRPNRGFNPKYHNSSTYVVDMNSNQAAGNGNPGVSGEE